MEESQVSRAVQSKSLLDRISFVGLLILTALLPIFFIPSNSISLVQSKTVLFALGILVVFCLFVAGRLKEGKLVFSRDPLFFSALGILVTGFISAVLSPVQSVSFLGGAEISTFAFLLVAFLSLFLVCRIFTTRSRIFSFYLAFLLSLFLVFIFQVSRLFLGESFLSFNIFTSISSSLVGGANDLAVYFGLSAILTLFALESLKLERVFKVLLSIALALSLFFLAIINFFILWIVLAVFSLVFSVYITSSRLIKVGKKDDAPVKALPVAPYIVLAISIIFIFGNTFIGSYISKYFAFSSYDVRPSFATTYQISKGVLSNNPFFGTGQNRFVNEWVKYKPSSINATAFWNTDFDFGIGFIPTLIINTGIFGLLAWCIFFALFIYKGFKSILAPLSDAFSRYLVMSSFLAGLYLWVFAVFYVPGVVAYSLAFLFTGIFIAALEQEKIIKVKTLSFEKNPRLGFVSVLVLVLLLIGAVTLGYSFARTSFAQYEFLRGVNAFNSEKNIDKSESLIKSSIVWGETSLSYRALSELNLYRMNALVASSKAPLSDAVKNQFQNYLGSAIESGRNAISADSTDYKNWIALGQVYETLIPLGIEGAYKNAGSSYDSALALHPNSPMIFLAKARLELANKQPNKSLEYLEKSLTQKSNYTDAIFLLAQVESELGNTDNAISALQSVSFLSPNDAGILFQLGLMKFNKKDFKGSVEVLERAVKIIPSYSNARYYLGLAYDKLGKRTDAIAQFQNILSFNPDNKDIKTILENLRANHPALSKTAEVKASSRKKPPISESDQASL